MMGTTDRATVQGELTGWFMVKNEVLDYWHLYRDSEGRPLTTRAFAVYCALSRYTDRDSRGQFFIKRLAHELGADKATVKAALVDLVGSGLIALAPGHLDTVRRVHTRSTVVIMGYRSALAMAMRRLSDPNAAVADDLDDYSDSRLREIVHAIDWRGGEPVTPPGEPVTPPGEPVPPPGEPVTPRGEPVAKTQDTQSKPLSRPWSKRGRVAQSAGGRPPAAPSRPVADGARADTISPEALASRAAEIRRRRATIPGDPDHVPKSPGAGAVEAARLTEEERARKLAMVSSFAPGLVAAAGGER